MGYRLKNVKFKTNIGGKSTKLKGDINIKADLSVEEDVNQMFDKIKNTYPNVYALVNNASSLYQMYGIMCDVFFYDKDSKKIFSKIFSRLLSP